MICASTNNVSISSLPIYMMAEGEAHAARTAQNDGQVRVNAIKKYIISPENFAWLELSLVPEIEQVFVDRDASGTELRVVEVVDKRDAAVRARIYEREKEIMAAHPRLGFDFHIIARQGRDISEVMQIAGKAGFRR